MSVRVPQNIQIADVTGDCDQRTMAAAGRTSRLDRPSCQLLEVLAQRLGECVDKESLLRTAWPNQIVHENSLAKAISELRVALAGSRLEIVARDGAGYTLQVRDETHREVLPPALPTSYTPQVSASRLPTWAWPALVLLAALVSVGGLAWRHSTVAIRSTPPITHDAANALATMLWVDDHPANNRLEVALFKRRHIAVHLAASTEDALKLLAMNHYDLVVSDLGRGEDRLAGLKMVQAMRQRRLGVPVIIYTVRPKLRAGQQAERLLVAQAGAADLAVTPAEVRAKVLKRLVPDA